MLQSHETKSKPREKGDVMLKWRNLLFVVLRYLCFSLVLTALIILFSYLSSKMQSSFFLDAIITFGIPTIIMFMYIVLYRIVLLKSFKGFFRKFCIPFLRYLLFAILLGFLNYLLLSLLNYASVNFPINVVLSFFFSLLVVYFLIYIYVTIVSKVKKLRINQDREQQMSRSNKAKRIGTIPSETSLELREGRFKKLIWIVIPLAIGALLGAGGDVLVDIFQRGGAKRNPYIAGEQITATAQKTSYGKSDLPDAEEVLLKTLMLSSTLETRKADVIKFESDYDVNVQTFSASFLEEESKSPYIEFFDGGRNRYYIGGYFSLWVTNTYDYDFLIKKFSINACNIVADNSPNISINGWVNEYTVDLYVYNAGWGPAYDIEVGISDVNGVFNSIWSSDYVGLSIPTLLPGEAKLIRLISLPDLSDEAVSLISGNDKKAYLNIYAKCKDNINANPSTSIIFSIINGAFKNRNGMGSSSQPVPYGILVQTNDESFSISYTTRDIVPAKNPVEFLTYLIADKSCEMSIQFEFETSDGLVLKSPQYDNIRITVPYYDGNARYNASDLSEEDKANPNIEVLYPY